MTFLMLLMAWKQILNALFLDSSKLHTLCFDNKED